MRRVFWLIIFICVSSVAQAQFSDSVRHNIAFTGTGTINRTNEGQSYVFNNGLRYRMRRKDAELNSTNTWIYGSQRGKLTNNDFFSGVDFNLYKTFPHFYYWGLGIYESSYSLRIFDRTQAGAGIAYNLIDRDSLELNISDGLLYEHSSLNVGDTAINTYSTVRNSLRLRLRYRYRKLVTFSATGFLQQSLSDGKDYVIKSMANLSFHIWKGVSVTSALTYNKVNLTHRENLLVTYGVTVDQWF